MSSNTNNQENNQELSRGLQGRHVQLIALGGTIGTGLFLGAGQSIHLAGPSIIFAYLITGIVCFLLMRALGELLLSDLDAHSFIAFISKYLGKTWGFVAGWTYWICWLTIAMAELTASGLYLRYWFPNLPEWVTGIAILLILLLINSVTVRAFGETEFWFAIIKIVAILGLIAIGIYMVAVHYKTPVGYAEVGNLFKGGLFANGSNGFLLSFQMVLFSFVGIEMVGMTASETANPTKIIPKAIDDIPFRIIIFYLGSLLALMCIYPWQNISPNQSPFVQVFSAIGIRSAATIINFVVLTAAVSACNSSLFTTGRMLFSLTYGGKSKLSGKLSKLSRTQVPGNALRFSAIIIAASLFLNLFMPGHVFTFISSIATTCFLFIWGSIILAHLKYRKTKAAKSAKFKLPFAPFTDYLVLAFLAGVGLILLMKLETMIALIGSIVWLIALWAFDKLLNKRATKA
ncbi:alanine glycine permease [Secundilactobacillus oryzae JCM 18671]|uniref:Alanine glycine permease n=1 Tax=Secundilactobacillus oryzae JCM 18671 TaxID=1291743 RepID=A0A081BIY9_9LACO|nr:amino acid permease [Secundilactobacillus oryzae]GAK48007.1 alanine glycine permease [Secundilactobacillus oryzae JCM 18671]